MKLVLVAPSDRTCPC